MAIDGGVSHSAARAVPDCRVGVGADGAAALWPFCSLLKGGGRGFVPAAEALFFVSPKKSTPKKGDPTCTPCCAGSAALLNLGGVSLNSLRSNRREPFFRPSLRCSPCPTGGWENTAAAAQRRLFVSIRGHGCFAARWSASALPNTSNGCAPGIAPV